MKLNSWFKKIGLFIVLHRKKSLKCYICLTSRKLFSAGNADDGDDVCDTITAYYDDVCSESHIIKRLLKGYDKYELPRRGTSYLLTTACFTWHRKSAHCIFVSFR